MCGVGVGTGSKESATSNEAHVDVEDIVKDVGQEISGGGGP